LVWIFCTPEALISRGILHVMRTTAFILLVAISSLLGAAPAEAVVAGPGNISAELLKGLESPNFMPPLDRLYLAAPEGVNLPAALIEPIPNDLSLLDPSEAVGRNVVGATGGLTHPACVAETARRASEDQPPPHGDFPCVVPTSNSSGIVEGVCFVHECRGVSSTGLDGLMSALGSLSSLSSIVSSILGNLLQPKPSSPLDGSPSGVPATNPTAEQSTSFLITSAPLTELDMSRLFSDSAIVVRNLLSALNP